MIIHILVSVGFYLILLYFSINLLGFLVRGLFSNPELNKLKQEGSEFVKQQVKKFERTDKWINIVALVLLVVYFYALFHFWNVGVVLAAVIIMAGRLPDLLWEIKYGRKMTLNNANSLTHNALYYTSTFLPWISLPILYYSLYFL